MSKTSNTKQKVSSEYLSDAAEKQLRAHGHNDWVDSFDKTVKQALKDTKAEPLRGISGGLYGSIIEVLQNDETRILKLMPLEIAVPQIEALEVLSGDSCPRIYETNEEAGWVLMEELLGEPAGFDRPIAIKEAYKTISSVWNHPMKQYPSSYRTLTAPWFEEPEDSPKELKDILRTAYLLDMDRANEPQFHVHGDIGVHNLFLLEDGGIAFVDPSGTFGPKTWDIGCLAAWSGRPKLEAVDTACGLAKISDTDEKEVARWAIIRTIASANLGFQRGNLTQYKECSEAIPVLLKQFDKLKSGIAYKRRF